MRRGVMRWYEPAPPPQAYSQRRRCYSKATNLGFGQEWFSRLDRAMVDMNVPYSWDGVQQYAYE